MDEGGLHKQGWSKLPHWCHDERLSDLWELVAQLEPVAQGHLQGKSIRAYFFAAIATHNHATRSKIHDYALLPTGPMAKRAKLARSWVPVAQKVLVAAGLLEQNKVGRFRPAPEFMDLARGFEAAERLLQELRTRVRTDRTVRVSTPQMSRTGTSMSPTETAMFPTGHPKDGIQTPQVSRREHGAASSPHGTRSLTVEEAGPQARTAETDIRRMKKKKTATVPDRDSLYVAPPTPTDPTQGDDPQESDSVPSAAPPVSASGADPALLQDGGPCVDCGHPIDESDHKQKMIVTYIRNRRRAGDKIRWSHQAIPSAYASACAAAAKEATPATPS